VIHAGWGVRFTVTENGGAVVGQFDDYSAPFETTFTGLNQGDHDVDVTIIDGSGAEAGGVNSSDQASQVGIGDYYVGIGDSITKGFLDDVASDDTSLDGRNTLGGYEPVLNNLLTASRGYPNAVFNEGVAGDTSIEGLSLVPSIIAEHPEANAFLVQYGTNDAGLPLPSGLTLSEGQAGYSGSFKDNMQQIITMITNAGKQAYLAKAPFANGGFSVRNSLIQEYNMVIDELIFENSIGVTAPDFYSFFEVNLDQYADELHPNGIGYQSMANLWYYVLSP
jgi:lysophospholipase L1-like esterase